MVLLPTRQGVGCERKTRANETRVFNFRAGPSADAIDGGPLRNRATLETRKWTRSSSCSSRGSSKATGRRRPTTVSRSRSVRRAHAGPRPARGGAHANVLVFHVLAGDNERPPGPVSELYVLRRLPRPAHKLAPLTARSANQHPE